VDGRAGEGVTAMVGVAERECERDRERLRLLLVERDDERERKLAVRSASLL
jgi:hypothetical protein